MAIIRTALNEYRASKSSKRPLCPRTERALNDWDLAWNDSTLYVLDEHEWFDPRTSSKYDNGISRHAMWGPAAIVSEVRHNTGATIVSEYHVNDPRVWAWVRRCIAEGHLTNLTMRLGGPGNDEKDVRVTYV